MDSNHENNPFDKLPDALMLFILNKILETKTLVSCFLVSKRLASLIPLSKLWIKSERKKRNEAKEERREEMKSEIKR